jgi:hypothetical protein
MAGIAFGVAAVGLPDSFTYIASAIAGLGLVISQICTMISQIPPYIFLAVTVAAVFADAMVECGYIAAAGVAFTRGQ